MIDRDEGLVVREGQRLGRHDAHHHAADQPRPAGRGDGVEIGQPDTRFVERLGDQPVDALEMRPRGDLRHHAAETPMLGELAVDCIGQNPADRLGPGLAFDHGDGGLVTARFDAQHAHAGLLAARTPGRQMTDRPVGQSHMRQRSLTAFGMTIIAGSARCVGSENRCHPERSDGPFASTLKRRRCAFRRGAGCRAAARRWIGSPRSGPSG